MTEKNREEKLQEEMFDVMLRYAAKQAAEEFADEHNTDEQVEFSQRHQKEMEKLFNQMEERITPIFYVRRIAAVFAILAVVTVTSVMSVDAWRVKLFNFFTKPSQTNTEVRYRENEPKGNTYSTDMVRLDYIPEGMQIKESFSRRNEEVLDFVNGEEFFKLRVARTGAVSYMDTENKATEKISLNGVEAYLLIDEDKYALKWSFENKAYTLMGNLDKEMLLKIAENIH